MNYLTLGIHYPKKEHLNDIIEAAKKVAMRAKECNGIIDTGVLYEEAKDRIIMFSLWENSDLAMEASKILRPMITEFPFSEWERQPSDNMVGLKRLI